MHSIYSGDSISPTLTPRVGALNLRVAVLSVLAICLNEYCSLRAIIRFLVLCPYIIINK